MKVLFLGDIHGDFEDLEVWDGKVDHIVQVGDFGYWPNFHGWNPPRMVHTKVSFIDGNHENHDELQALPSPSGEFVERGIAHNVFYQPRGSILTIEKTNILCVGGAFSIDKNARTPGFDWFPQEEFTASNLEDAVKNAYNAGVDFVVSHDAPEGFGAIHGSHHNLGEGVTRMGLQALLGVLSPRPTHWFFGHHHRLADGQYTKGGNPINWHLCPIGSRRVGWLWDTKTQKIEVVREEDLKEIK